MESCQLGQLKVGRFQGWRLNICFPTSGSLQVDQHQCSFNYFEFWFIHRSHSIYPFGESINLLFYQWSSLSDMLLSRIHKYFKFMFMLKSALSVNKYTRRLWTIDNYVLVNCAHSTCLRSKFLCKFLCVSEKRILPLLPNTDSLQQGCTWHIFFNSFWHSSSIYEIREISIVSCLSYLGISCSSAPTTFKWYHFNNSWTTPSHVMAIFHIYDNLESDVIAYIFYQTHLIDNCLHMKKNLNAIHGSWYYH